MTLLEKEWFIEAPWGRICVVAWGECSDPPVLLCHGSVDSAACFRPLVKLLPKNFYYVGIELPGNGKSDHYPAGMMISVYDLVYAMAFVVQHFRWQTFVFMAHSLGTLVGLLYNISYPGKITKVVNFDPVPMMAVSPKEFGKWYHKYFTKYLGNFDAYNTPKENGPRYKWREALIKLMEKRGLSEENAAATLARVSEPVEDGLIRYTFDQRMKLIHRPPYSADQLVAIITSVRTPTLSVLAKEGTLDRGNYDHLKHLVDETQHPHGNYRALIVEGGHDVHFESPERMAVYVGQFLLYGLQGLDLKAKL